MIEEDVLSGVTDQIDRRLGADAVTAWDRDAGWDPTALEGPDEDHEDDRNGLMFHSLSEDLYLWMVFRNGRRLWAWVPMPDDVLGGRWIRRIFSGRSCVPAYQASYEEFRRRVLRLSVAGGEC